MKRKVAKIGSSTLMISLPNKWAKKFNIKKGDELEIEEEGAALNIATSKQKKEIKGKVIAKEPRRLINRSIYNLYRAGANEIEVIYEDLSLFGKVEDAVSNLMGFEIVEQGKNNCILKNVAKIEDSEFDSMFRRYFLVTISLAEESLTAIKNKEYDSLDSITRLEATQNRYYLYCARVINISGDKLFKKPNLMFLLNQRLEDVADDYKYICRYLIENPDVKISEEVLRLYEKVNAYLRKVYEFYYKFDVDVGADLMKEKKILNNKSLSLMESAHKKEIRIVHILSNLIVKIYEASSPIFGMRL